MKKSQIINVIIICIFCCSLFFCAQTSQDVSQINLVEPTEIVENNVITFVDPVIEAITREKLNQPTGDITKEQALSITSLNFDSCEDLKSLDDLKWFENLKWLSASGCGISDISILATLTQLDDLNLSDNQISDISALKNLINLTYLDLENNQITDLTPIKHLEDQLYYSNFYNNLITEENWLNFYYPIKENHDIFTFHGTINETLPEFTFNIYAYLNPTGDNYPVYELYSLEIKIGDEIVQTLPIADQALFYQTNVPDSEIDILFALEDVNFDDYLDIRLFDTYNAKYINFIYLVWNPETGQFEGDNWKLNDIHNARFDQTNGLIYSVESGGGGARYYLVYQYIDNEITLISEEEIEILYLSDEQVRKYLELANIETADTEFLIERRTLWEYNHNTGEMESVSDKFLIYAFDDYNYSDDDPKLLIVDVTSAIGKVILHDEENDTSKNNIITFNDPVIETAVREELKQPTGDITKEQALEISILDISGQKTQGSLDDLIWFKNLTCLYASQCEISDISALRYLPKLHALDLEKNNIEDITPLFGLEKLFNVNLFSNPITTADWHAFFYPIEENHVHETIDVKLHEDLPEFTFDVSAYLNPDKNVYEIYSLYMSLGEECLNYFNIQQLIGYGQTEVPLTAENMGLSFVDMNFDGYSDVQLYVRDYQGINCLHFVFNLENYMFIQDDCLDNIPTPTFDAEQQYIFGEHHSEFIHHYYTYKYVDDGIILFRKTDRYDLFPSTENVKKYLSLANIESSHEKYWLVNEITAEYVIETKQSKIIEEKYIIYLMDDHGNRADELICIDATSQLGQYIAETLYDEVL